MSRKSEPLIRSCLVTRDQKPVDDMIRFVLSPNGQVVADLKRNLPGRGVWVTASAAKVAEAQKKRLFARGFRTDVKIDNDLAVQVDAVMEKHALGSLGLAVKAGQVVTGFSKVEAAIVGRKAGALIQAMDAADDGVRKITRAVVRTTGSETGLKVIRLFRSEQLDLALGRTNVIHAALLSLKDCSSFLEKTHRLAVYREMSDGMMM